MPPRPRRNRSSPRDAAVRTVRTLREAGYTAYLAGGCVRDALLGLEPKDYDVATDARPEAVLALFPRSRSVGEAFGVVLANIAGWPIEVATFRSEWGYTDRRRPDHVIFTDAEHDARRRDFTINGLFADPLGRDPETGGDRVIDYVGGRADLAAGIVRAIGDPGERFGEDYLRMLRAVRFAARLGFVIEPGTAAAIRPLARHLGQISRERIGQEVQLMLEGPRPAMAATLMQELRLDGPVLNEDHLDRPAATLAALADEAAYPTKLAAWMIDRGGSPKSEVQSPKSGEQSQAGEGLVAVAGFVEREAKGRVGRWRKALCLSNQQRDALWGVLALLAAAHGWPGLEVAGRKRLLAAPAWPEARRLLAALAAARGERVAEEVAQIEREAAPLVAEGVAPRAWVSGDDLVELGLEPGPRFGRLLEAVYDAQLDGRVRSRTEALAWVAQDAGRGGGDDKVTR